MVHPFMIYCLFIVTGVVAGFFSGLLGIGGGIIVVPLLSLALKYSHVHQDIVMHVTIATSLAIMMFTTQASLREHHNNGYVKPAILRALLPGVVIGTISGTLLGDYLSTRLLELLFGIFIIIIAIRMMLLVKTKPHRKLPDFLGTSLVGWLIGAKSGLLGLGGGSLSIPFLTRCNISLRDAVGTSAALSFTIASIGTLTAIITGYNEPNVPQLSTGYIHWPAVLFVALPSMLVVRFGAALSYRLPTDRLKRIFAIILFLMALHILWR